MAYTEEQKREHIRELQRYLFVISCYDSRISPMIANGVYDAKTQEAVRQFQKIYKLTVNGEVNETTWNKIVSVYQNLMETMPNCLHAFPSKKDAVMQSGDSCFTVMIIQTVLFALSKYYNNIPGVPVTGDFDRETAQAVQLFQDMCALPVTGIVDCKTWNILAQIGCDLKNQK